MPSHSAPREAAVFVESSLAEDQTNWDSNATEIYILSPNVEGVSQQNIPNENIQPRRHAVHAMVRGLKSTATLTHGMYLHGNKTATAITNQATSEIQDKILKSAWGGVDLGYADGLSGGSATVPDLDADSGTFVAGDWFFFYDDSAGSGEFGRGESLSTLSLTLLWGLEFTPAAADSACAVVDIYGNEDALNNHDDANHTTLGWLVQGEHAEDVYELKGCKPTVGDISITAGELVALDIAYKSVTHDNAGSAQTFTSTPSGSAPPVPGTGTTCKFKIADFGSTLLGADVDLRGTFTFRPNVDHEQVMGPNGTEGVHGYVATGLGEAQVECVIEYDNTYDTDWGAETKKHMMIQVGDQPGSAWALYFPRLEYMEKPVRVDEGGVTSVRLLFRCMEDTASVSGLTGDDIDKRRAPWHLLLSCPLS
jgi:hypothetical protein